MQCSPFHRQEEMQAKIDGLQTRQQQHPQRRHRRLVHAEGSQLPLGLAAQGKQSMNEGMEEMTDRKGDYCAVEVLPHSTRTVQYCHPCIPCVQTDHDANLTQRNLIHHRNLRIQEEYVLRETDLVIEQRV